MSTQLALSALRAGRWDQGLELLDEILKAPQPPTVEGPLHGLRAQALLELSRPEEAKEALRQALRIAKALGDEQAVKQLRSLNSRIYAELAHEREQARLAEEQRAELARPLDEQLAQAASPAERSTVLLRKANAEDDLELARRALDEAAEAGVREKVLARLCLVRLEPALAEQHLRSAHAIADAAEEPQLVTAVAQAARVAGVDFATHIF